jgi:hypothetical protein
VCTKRRRRLADVDKPLVCAVVIAWVNPYPLLKPGLRAILANRRQPDEIIVVTRHCLEMQRQFRDDFPQVTLLSQSPESTIPALRAIGIRASSSAVVLVTEDHCTPAGDWVERATRAILAGSGVVSGPVENACTSRWRDWAAFLTEYSGVVRPAVRGVVNGVPGNNVAYRRDVADEVARTLADGLWESFALPSLEKRVRFTFDPDMLVNHARPFDFNYFGVQRYHFCRAFAGMRLGSQSGAKRWLYVCGSVVLPVFLFWRALRNLLERRRLIARFLICSPLILFYFVVGALGEMAGYAFGSTDSLRYVE